MINETGRNIYDERPADLDLKEHQDLTNSPRIEILRKGFEGSTNELEELLEKHNIPQMVSNITGLDWKTASIKLRHTESQADWEGDDTVLVNLDHGPYCISGLSHEMVHLLFRQNNWLESTEISKFIENHPEMREYSAGKDGYPIEQMVAYLVQDEICKKIGKKEGLNILAETGGHGDFEKILDTEYGSDIKKKIGKTMMERWTKLEDYSDVLKWIESLLKEIDNG